MIYFQVQEVTTKLSDKILIDKVSFTVEKGEVLALVGHNGAGKSTLLKTIMKMIDKHAGKIVIKEKYDQDENLLLFKKHISYLPEEPMLLPELTVMQHFQLYALSYDIDAATFEKKVQYYVEQFNLIGRLDSYPEQLSKGMRQKVQAICSFLPDVPVLLIDEPFMGLDIYAKQFILALMKEKLQIGTCIILTTHQLELLEGLANTYVTLEHGRIVERGTIDQFDTITRGTYDG